jgi:shikimate dehydrogenase
MKCYGVIGNPIGHSLSPAMHNSQFNTFGIEAIYLPFHVNEEGLRNAIDGMRGLKIRGMSVTIPHKESIIKHLDEIDEEASKIGAVNTIINENNKLIGTNTDGKGFISSVIDYGFSLKDKKVLIIGAGGASRAIIYRLSLSGVSSITVANRTTSRAKELLSEIGIDCRTTVISLNDVSEIIDEFDLVVNTTSVGMSPNISEIPFTFDKVKKGSHFIDIIYNPYETKFLNRASTLGATVQNGIGMFVHQGAIAFELWTGKKADIKLMEKVVVERLGEKNNANR